jgi:ketosteroid isomerase-like protein
MIYVSHVLPVNEPGQPRVTRDDLWRGLVAKAGNALPFVAAMSRCDVLERHSENVFDRSISFRGQDFVERITLEEPHRVVFTRLSGPVLGTIANEIEGAGDALSLRFSFALVVQGVDGGSAAEREYADGMTDDYLKAVASTLDAVRRVVRGEAALTPLTPRQPRETPMSDWITDYYADVDAMRLPSYLDRHTDDAEVVFGNNPPAVGKQAIGEAIGGFWSMIGGLRHERRNLWFVDDGRTAVLEALLHYTTKGGAEVEVPCVSILDRAEDGRVSSLRVHIDLAPLFERIGAEAAPQDVAS